MAKRQCLHVCMGMRSDTNNCATIRPLVAAPGHEPEGGLSRPGAAIAVLVQPYPKTAGTIS